MPREWRCGLQATVKEPEGSLTSGSSIVAYRDSLTINTAYVSL
jgi:hypothetical protein